MPANELSALLAPPSQEITPKSAGAVFPDLGTEYSPPEPPKRKGILIAAAAAVLVIASALLVWRYAFQPEPATFQFARVEQGPIDAAVSATGTLNAVVDVQVGSQVSGNIKALYADFNTKVKAGQLVALIDPAPFEAAVDQAKATLNAAKAAVVAAQATLAKAQSDEASALANVANQKANIVKAQSAVDFARVEYGRKNTLLEEGITSQEDSDTAKATYDQAVAGLDASKAALDASQAALESSKKQVEVAQTQLDSAQAVVQQDEAVLAQAQLNLDHTRIVAPVDGTVIARRMDVGQTVAASFQAPTIFEIAQDLTKMQVDTNVAESDIGRLKVDQQAAFTVDAFPGHVFHGRVMQIRQAPINVQNVITYDAVIEAANPDLKLFPGMTANATILTQHSDNALRLPNAALRLRPPEALLENPMGRNKLAGGNEAVVYLAGQKGKVQAVPVKLGITDGNFTQVLYGDLHEGQQVIVGIVSSVPSAQPQPSAPSMPRRF